MQLLKICSSSILSEIKLSFLNKRRESLRFGDKMEMKVDLVLSLMLLMYMNSVLVLAEEEPTVGQRIDTATNDVTKFFNEPAGPAVDTVSSSAKSVYNWFGDKAKEWGL